jgi:hypothetical protein
MKGREFGAEGTWGWGGWSVWVACFWRDCETLGLKGRLGTYVEDINEDTND